MDRVNHFNRVLLAKEMECEEIHVAVLPLSGFFTPRCFVGAIIGDGKLEFTSCLCMWGCDALTDVETLTSGQYKGSQING